MSQTAERLIDKLKIAIFNVDEWGMVQLSLTDAKAIGAQLRLLVGEDAISALCDRMGLTRREKDIYVTLRLADGNLIKPARLAMLVGCKSVGGIHAHKCRLLAKLAHHGAGHIETVRGEGYRYVAEGGRE